MQQYLAFWLSFVWCIWISSRRTSLIWCLPLSCFAIRDSGSSKPSRHTALKQRLFNADSTSTFAYTVCQCAFYGTLGINGFKALYIIFAAYIQSNFNGLNTDGWFTMAYSNSFLSPYGIFPITQVHIYWGKFSYFIMKLYVVCTH